MPTFRVTLSAPARLGGLFEQVPTLIESGVDCKVGMWRGIVAAAKEVHLAVPLVVRMRGTNEDLGKQILKDSGLPIISADNMADAAQKIVAAVAARQES